MPNKATKPSFTYFTIASTGNYVRFTKHITAYYSILSKTSLTTSSYTFARAKTAQIAFHTSRYKTSKTAMP